MSWLSVSVLAFGAFCSDCRFNMVREPAGGHFPGVFLIQCHSKGNKSGGARERRRREPLGGSGGILPQKILKSRGLEMLFPAFSKSYL